MRKLLVFISLICLFVSCNGGDAWDREKFVYGNSIPKEYWGTWIRMDTGAEYYIDAHFVYEKNLSRGNSIRQSGIDGFSFDGENVLINGNYRYFRKGGGNRSFSLTTAGFSNSFSRAVTIGKQGVTGRRQNKNNSADREEKTSDSKGNLEFTDAVADDEQEIIINSDSSKTTITVTPQYDGENVGTVPIVEKGKYGFKTSYKINGDAQGFCYGNSFAKYTLQLSFKNVGVEDCAASVYVISCNDSKLKIDGNVTGNFTTITAGNSNDITLLVQYGTVIDEYVDVPINISITDRKYEQTWEDSVTLRFYKGVINVKVNARNFNSTYGSTLKGFFIYPDGRSKRFTVSNKSSATLTIPWSEKDYILAFSGATADNEMAYSFCINDKVPLANLDGIWSLSEMNAYKSNSTKTAYKVTNFSNPVKAYLGAGDVEFFTFNVKNLEVSN